jgi:heat shock protein HtpX
MNYVKTTVLMVLLTVLLMFVGGMIGGEGGMMGFFILSMLINFGTYWFSDKIVLKMYRAKPLSREEAPNVYRALDELIQRAGIPMPKVYLVPSDTPNAFATGRNPQHAALAIHAGLLKILDYEEIKGVLAHELAHIKNRDCMISMVAAGIAGAIMMVARIAQWGAIFGGFGGRGGNRNNNIIGFLFMIIVAPLAALFIQLAISRSREYAADATGAKFVGSSFGLANALLKLEQGNKQIPMNASPATAHMFIMNPFSRKGLGSLFSTHPPVEERVRRLRELSNL